MSVLAVSLFALQLPVSEPVEFPEHFRGVWNSSSQPCDESFEDSSVTIASDTIDFWETRGIPEVISRVDENDISIVFAMSGEGENWREQIRFVMDRSGDRMFSEFVPLNGEPFRRATWFYQRCPAVPQANRG